MGIKNKMTRRLILSAIPTALLVSTAAIAQLGPNGIINFVQHTLDNVSGGLGDVIDGTQNISNFVVDSGQFTNLSGDVVATVVNGNTTGGVVAIVGNTIASVGGAVGHGQNLVLGGSSHGGTLDLIENNGLFDGGLDTGHGTIATTEGSINDGTVNLGAISHGNVLGLGLQSPIAPNSIQVFH